MTEMSDTSVDIPRPDRHGHTPMGVSRCPGCLALGLFNKTLMADNSDCVRTY
jgi:hypothetical protein